MDTTAALFKSKENLKNILFDIFALAFIYFLPAISHLLVIPIYLFEPMRIMMILSLAHTTKKNTYVIAISLPLFSFFVSAHPLILKSLLMAAELILNIWLFYFILHRIKNVFGSILLSIIISKMFYYLVKYFLIVSALLSMELFSTPLYLQVITTLVFSFYILFVWRKKEQ
ncbi:MAG: hypothetical protein A2V66_16140 [Ignavibacteria bacterium RBG_13_36_8]|nr:MAG: hypothetical protein A2V66_16140 [Ignavibacteria bacterium RBG_13_36_8]